MLYFKCYATMKMVLSHKKNIVQWNIFKSSNMMRIIKKNFKVLEIKL